MANLRPNNRLVLNVSIAVFDGTSGSEVWAGCTFATSITMEEASG